MDSSLHDELIVVDGLQYSNWDRTLFEEMHRGGLTAVHATVVYWESAREAISAIGQWHQRFERHADLIIPVRCAGDIHAAKRARKVGVFLGFQNCSPIEDEIALVEVFRRLDVLVMQLSYNNQSLIATGCYEENDPGITRFGRQVIREMNRVGMVIDMSHSAERSTLEAIEISRRPIVISHANPAWFRPALRNKSDTVLRALAQSGGLLGFSTYPFHLKNGSECTLDEFCSMIARTVEIMGIDQVGLGSDLCLNQPYQVLHWMRNGRWAKETDFGEGSAADADWPKPLAWLPDAAGYPNLTAGLVAKGFSRDEIAKIMGLNWVGFLERSIGPQPA